MRTRRLKTPWPFLYSATKRGLVQNLPPRPKKPSRLKPVRPSDKWEQEALW